MNQITLHPVQYMHNVHQFLIYAKIKLRKEVDRKRTEQSFMVPKKDIVENEYDLSINKYKEVEYIPVEYPPTSEIMANIRELENEIGKEMDELEKLLKM